MVLNLGSIEPQGFVESVSGVRQRSRILRLFSTLICSKYSLIYVFVWNSWFVSFVLWTQWFCVQLMHDSFCALIKYIYLCFKEIIFYFSNYEGLGECTDEACRVQLPPMNQCYKRSGIYLFARSPRLVHHVGYGVDWQNDEHGGKHECVGDAVHQVLPLPGMH